MYLILAAMRTEQAETDTLELWGTALTHEAAMQQANDYLGENCADGRFERIFVVESVGGWRLNPVTDPDSDEPICLPI